MRSIKREQKLAKVARRISSDLELLLDELDRLHPDIRERLTPPKRGRNWGLLFGAAVAFGAIGAVLVRRFLEQTAIEREARRAEAESAMPRGSVTEH